MKKGLLASLLAILLITPVFATTELDLKAGIPFYYKKAHLENKDLSITSTMERTFSFEMDCYYYINPKFAIGLGANHIFSSETKFMERDTNIAYTNIYIYNKYIVPLNDDTTFNNIYFIGQLGYGLLDFNINDFGSIDAGNGLYWGLGIGTTIKEHFILELIYSCNYGIITAINSIEKDEYDLTYKILKLNLGYKFSL